MKSIKQLVFLFSFSFLFSCSMMSKQDCQNANWKAIGYKAATMGESVKHFSKVNRQCHEYGISANKNEYAKGRTAGLIAFCTYKNGRKFGYRNKNYDGICPSSLETDFLRGYNLGKSEYMREEQERALEEQRKRQEAELKRMREEQEEELERMRKSSKGYNSSNCAHITTDGGCAHEL